MKNTPTREVTSVQVPIGKNVTGYHKRQGLRKV